MGRKVSPLGAILGLGLLLWADSSGKAPPDAPDPKTWIEGPVRYIATKDEIDVFRSLDTDAARTSFIERFWRRRDPLPETSANEYRHLFWERVKEANDHFGGGTAPGWKTDQGKMHILCGPPSRVEEDLFADTKGVPAAGRGLIRWVYEGTPCGRTDLGPMMVVPFVRDFTGAYRLSSDPKLSSLTFDSHDLTDTDNLGIERWLAIVAPPDRSVLGVMLDLGRLQEAPHPEQILLDRVETLETYGSHPLSAEVARYQPPRGGILLVITVSVPDAEPSRPPSLIARLAPRDASLPKRFLGEESFRLEGAGPDRVAQARIVVDPGTYDLTILSSQPGSSGSGLYRGVAEVPRPPDGLHLSDVVLAQTLEPLPYPSLVSYDEPYLLGAFRVVPRVRKPLKRGDPVIAFYDVYGGSAPFRISYQVEGKEDDGRWTTLGRPTVQEQAEGAQGWSLTTGTNWPQGEYRIQIRVEDSKQQAASAVLPFTLQ